MAEITRDSAMGLVREHTTNENLIKHMLAVEAAMRAYARRFDQDEELWAAVGLVHDFDYEQHPTMGGDLPKEEWHVFAGAKILRERGWPEEIVLNVNMDMVSRSDSLLFAAGPFHYPRLRPMLDAVAARPPVVLRFGHDQPGVEGVDDWTGSSDHRVFHQGGIPFVYFGVEDHDDYHRPTDEFDRVDQAFFLNAIRTVLAGVLALDERLGQTASPTSGT